MKKDIFILAILISLITVSCSNVGSLEIKIFSKNSLTDPAELPIWNSGNYWIYDMRFNFQTPIFRVNANISDMIAYVEREEIYNGKEYYKMKISSPANSIVGSITISSLDGLEIRGKLDGYAYIEKATLGMMELIFIMDGEVQYLGKWHDLFFEMTETFTPVFDFLDFPIKPDDINWRVMIDQASIEAKVDINIIGEKTIHKEFSETDSFEDEMTLKDVKDINYPSYGDGTFETFIVGGDWGKTSELFYVPKLGFLAKVDESLDMQGVVADFYLELKETNYDTSNYPPVKPELEGPESGDLGQEVQFQASSNDPELGQLFYWIDWGDGTNTGWIGPYESGALCTALHSWSEKGTFNIMAKARDLDNLESPWSNPRTITIAGAAPHLTIIIHRIEALDEIDVLSEPELYYKLSILIDGEEDKIFREYNTDTGEKDGEWNESKVWVLNKEYTFTTDERYAKIRFKLMDDDGIGDDWFNDLADVSGCNYPDDDGDDDDIPDKRGAIFHQTFDLANGEFIGYSLNPDDNADFVAIESEYGKYSTSGDYPPDESTEFEGGLIPNPQNDAKVWFTVITDYTKPIANAIIVDAPNQIRTNMKLQFNGAVTNGVPPYTWKWDFGDGKTSDKQNPIKSYSEKGIYSATLTVTDYFDQKSNSAIIVNVAENQKPIRLEINGDSIGNAGKTYEYSFSAVDPEEDQVYYKINWGDGYNTEWLGPYASGSEISLMHSWNSRNMYTITLSVKDEYDATNSATLKVQMPKQLIKVQFILEKLLSNLKILINNFF